MRRRAWMIAVGLLVGASAAAHPAVREAPDRYELVYYPAAASMEGTLYDGEYVLADRYAFRERQPAVGEVVLLDHPDYPYRLTKRVAEVTPEGELYVLGDNAANSRDSRDPTFGTIPPEQVYARVLRVVWSPRSGRLGFQP